MAALIDGFDFGALETLSLQHETALSALDAAVDGMTFTTLSSTRIDLQNGDYGISLTGNGLSPVGTAAQLQQAIDQGFASGSFDRLSMTQSQTEILSIDFDAGGMTFTSGTTSLRFDGALPGSFDDIWDLSGLLESASNIEQMSESQREALFNQLSATSLTGVTLTDAGDELLALELSDTQASIRAGGVELTATGTLGDDLGDLARVAFEMMEAEPLSDADLTLYDASGNFLQHAYWPSMQLSGMASGTYYIEVSAYMGNDKGAYTLDIASDAGGTQQLITETADAAGTTGTQYSVSTSARIEGNIESFGERDWYRFDYTAGETVFVNIEENDIDLSGLESFDISGVTLGLTGETPALSMTGTILDDMGYDGTEEIFVDGVRYDEMYVAGLEGGSAGSVFFWGWDSDRDFMMGSTGNDRLESNDGNDRLLGRSGDDLIAGGAGFDTLDGGAGNDTINGGNGRDLSFLGAGNDLYVDNGQGGELGRDTVFAAAGDDRIEGGNGDDAFHGGTGNDIIRARLGDDKLYGGSGGDVLDGGAGNDFAWGGDGRDRVFLGAGNDKFFDTAQGGVHGQDTVYAGAGNDTIEGGNGNDQFFGGSENDVIRGRLGNDLIIGGDGFDTLDAGAGNDSVTGGNGRDLAFLGTGDDVYFDNGQGGVLGQDTVFAGAGNDTIQGGNGNDVFRGELGDDLIFGRLGNDMLEGGAGNDTLDGGAGADTFVFATGAGVDVVNGFEVGVDTLRLDAGLWTGALTETQVVTQFASMVGGNVVFDFGAEEFTLEGVNSLTGLDNDLTIV